MRDEEGNLLRLLPWTNENGDPCYLSTEGGRLSRLADRLEATLLASAEDVLVRAKPLLADERAGERELRFAGLRLAEALQDTVRIATSRGARLPGA
ncbi:hypothetical protein [Streptomyces sp. JW3]|uniref:hypothetical protein n=1 Tax=Streptomyces sp. JW3 TaxID=3456955 RepID=UPI003FA4C202